jgi:hypothetical protein
MTIRPAPHERGKPGLPQNACGNRPEKPVPLYWAYITAWATSDGVIQFRRDLYEKDGVGAVAAAY